MRTTSVTAHVDGRRSPQALRRRHSTWRNDARWQDAKLVGRAAAHVAIALGALAMVAAYSPAAAGANEDVAATARDVIAALLAGLFQLLGY